MQAESANDLAARLRDEVRIVLVQPQHPGNVGSAARACANMGLGSLVVVDPAPSFDPETVRWYAPSADEVLGRIHLVATLDEALRGTHRVIATTARHRRDGQRVLEPSDAAAMALDAPPGARTAILFGREDHGLPAEATRAAAHLLRIPTAAHASLNLGAAVLLVAHALFEAARARGLEADGRTVAGRRATRTVSDLDQRAPPPAPVDLLDPVLHELVEVLHRVGYTRKHDPAQVAVTLREVMQQAGLDTRQARGLRGMIKRIAFALDHPEIDWQATRSQRRAGGSATVDHDDP